MKTLYILRHAKSSWKFEELSDHDRPLTKRGRNDATLIGEELASRGVKPELIISSPAVRALSTATLVGKEIDYEADDIIIDDRVYGADPDDLLEVIQATPAEVDNIMIVGHNEGITEFVNTLSPEPVDNLPTAGIAALKFNCESWYDIHKDKAELVFLDSPKNYK